MAFMRVARRHPFFLASSIPFGVALGALSEANKWNDATLYGAMTIGLVFMGLVGALLLARERGPAVFGDRDDATRPSARR